MRVVSALAMAAAEQLCLQCGLCCNGVIFAQGQLQPEDDAVKLKRLGLAMKRNGKFAQPCGAFRQNCCAIYADRPSYCRQFDCALLKAVQEGSVPVDEAERIIRKTRSAEAKVRRLLRKLGTEDPARPLARQFHRTVEALHRGEVGADRAAFFSELTVAMHRLNVLLQRHYYPHES